MNDKFSLINTLSPKEKRDLLAQVLQEQAQELSSFPLSFAQQRLWFLHQWEPNGYLYNIPVALHLTGTLHVNALEQSLNEIVRRHEALRTTFLEIEGRPVQIIAPSLNLPIVTSDLTALSPSQQEIETRRLTTLEGQCPFALEEGPLLRVRVLHLAQEEHILLLTMHHTVFDGWSLDIFYKELSSLYNAYVSNKSPLLPELPIQYVDYTVWQREWLQGEVLEEQLRYWKQQLEGIAPLQLPTDRPRPAVQTFRGGEHPFAFSKEFSERLKLLSQQEGVTLFMVLVAALQTLLYRYTGQGDIAIGTPIANRTQAELEGLIGNFTNTLVLRTSLQGNMSFRALLGKVHAVTLGAYAHQDLPFERLVEELAPERDLSRTPFFETIFTYQNAPSILPNLTDLTLIPFSESLQGENGVVKFDLSLTITATPEGLKGVMGYSTDLFDASTIVRLIEHFRTLLEGVLAHPDLPLADIPLLTAAERLQVLEVWNDTQKMYPREQCLHELLEAQAVQTPGAIAVVCGEKGLTYRELDQRANQVAHHLRAVGVRPSVRVGICLERSLDMLVGLIAILKAGGVFLPLDPDYPTARLEYMVQDSNAEVLLVHSATLAAAQALLSQSHQIQTVTSLDCIARPVDFPPSVLFWNAEDIASYPDTPCVLLNALTDLAYIMYTSGSTGQPKGVPITHSNLMFFFQWTQSYFGFVPADRIIQYHSLSFDFSIWEIFEALCSGASLHLVTAAISRDIEALADYLTAEPITILNMTPSQFTALAEHIQYFRPDALRTLRLVVLGGEMLPLTLAQKAVQLLPPGCLLFNEYGPTETTISCGIFPITAEALARYSHRSSAPIGKPIANAQLYLLDTRFQPVPIGVPGEIFIGGFGLSYGYLNRPELTAERFVPNPFSTQTGARMYRTGDLACYLADGNIEFLRRIDQQVKMRGFRIEPGEIEAVLGGHPAVRDVVVLVQADTHGDKRLVAYIVPDAQQSITRDDLRAYLRVRLPDYMIPSSFVLLEALPLTANGKVDRHALPALEGSSPEIDTSYVAPQNPVEESLANIWAEVLGLERVGIYDNFFEVGGHSLLATQLMARVRDALQVELPLRTFFTMPNIAQQAAEIIRHQNVGSVSKVQTIPRGDKQLAQLLAELDQLSDQEAEQMIAAEMQLDNSSS